MSINNEIERRFLISATALKNLRVVDATRCLIDQYYAQNLDGTMGMRFRKVTTFFDRGTPQMDRPEVHYYAANKFVVNSGDRLVRIEQESEISEMEYLDNNNSILVLSKMRTEYYRKPDEKITIDTFLNCGRINKDQRILEIEFESLDAAMDPSRSWYRGIGREITNDPLYFNSNLYDYVLEEYLSAKR